jgi:MarR family transcriptional regulator, transcriptional regulator for hemolysin
MKIPPETEMTAALVRVARLYRQGVDEALSGLGLSDALALPVVVLGRRPEGVRQNQLADELGVEGPSLVRLLDRLVGDGLVERREDPADRRAKLVTLTAEGRRHSERAAKALDAYRTDLLEGSGPDDIQAALRLLRALQDRLITRRDGRS